MTGKKRDEPIFICYRREDSSAAAGRIHLAEGGPRKYLADQLSFLIGDVELARDQHEHVHARVSGSPDYLTAFEGATLTHAQDVKALFLAEVAKDFQLLDDLNQAKLIARVHFRHIPLEREIDSPSECDGNPSYRQRQHLLSRSCPALTSNWR